MMKKKQLGNILVEAGIITVITLERALERQKGSGKRLGMILEEMGVITEEELIAALAKQFGFRTVSKFASHTFLWEILSLIPEDLAIQKTVFPLQKKEDKLAVAITDPFDSNTLDIISKKSGLTVVPFLATRKDIMDALSRHYLGGKLTDRQRQRILVVDDSTTITNQVMAALRKSGYDVVVAHDGMEGFKMAIADRPDLIVCDDVMPRMDGYALKNAVQENPATASIPLILLTAKTAGEEEQRALDAGFIDFIAKPVQPLRIVSRVKRALKLVGK